jgi:DNA repair protein RecO (recombination protein O)
MRETSQRAYILINRPYSETSWIVEAFTREFGRIGLMAKGARQQKSKLKGALMLFQPVLIGWSGKGEVPTLISAEVDLSDYNLLEHELAGDALVCGFYCNELIANLLHRHDPHAVLFDRYHATLIALATVQKPSLMPGILRDFEIAVMKETGYAVDFEYEADGISKIDDLGFYRYQAGQGFVRVAAEMRGCFSGRVIKSLDRRSTVEEAVIAEKDLVSAKDSNLNSQELSQAKQLMRDILANSLGRKSIISRELFYPKHR